MKILVTGATSGHGLRLAEELAKAHTVLVHGRDRRRVEELARRLGGRPYVADLACLDAVRSLANEVVRDVGRIDMLVNNAGIGYGTHREESVDGHELRFAIMYLAPALLTEALLPHLVRGVLNIGSKGQESLDLDDLEMRVSYSGVSAYRRAKLALVMATMELAERRPDLRVNVVHPATMMDTNMVRRGGGTPLSTVDEGVRATSSALASEATGTFFDGAQPARAHADAYDHALRAALQLRTAALIGVSACAP